MERLTIKRQDGWHVEDWKNGIDHHGPAVDRLAAYEDTGMEPEEIKDFVSRWKEAAELAGLCKEAGIGRLRDLLDAEKELEAQK